MQLVFAADPANDPGQVLSDMSTPTASWNYKSPPNVRRPNAIDVDFGGAMLDYSTVAWGSPPSPLGTFELRSGGNPMPGTIYKLMGNRVRLAFPDNLHGGYLLRLFGTPAADSGGNAIRSVDGLRLDGERNSAWSSGDGVEGGDFGPIKLDIQ
jgi:hypothetical protein